MNMIVNTKVDYDYYCKNNDDQVRLLIDNHVFIFNLLSLKLIKFLKIVFLLHELILVIVFIFKAISKHAIQ